MIPPIFKCLGRNQKIYNSVHFLVQIRTRKFASQNYIPLIKGKVKGCKKVTNMDSFPTSVWLLSYSQAQTLAICIFLYFAKLCKVWARLEKLDFWQYAKRINIKFLTFQVKYHNEGHMKAKSLCNSLRPKFISQSQIKDIKAQI